MFPMKQAFRIVTQNIYESKVATIERKTQGKNSEFSKTLHWLMVCLYAVIVMIAVVLIIIKSPYLYWDFSDPETAVVSTAFHAFEWLFVRLAPFLLIGAIVGVFLTRKKEYNTRLWQKSSDASFQFITATKKSGFRLLFLLIFAVVLCKILVY